MNHPNFNNAAASAADLLSLLLECFQTVWPESLNLLKCLCGVPVNEDDHDRIDMYGEEMTASAHLANILDYIHDWKISFAGIAGAFFRALRGLPEKTFDISNSEELVARILERFPNLEAAMTGDGPQPWDNDWYEATQDLSDDIKELAMKAGWERLQNLIEIMHWALASPQAQQVIELNLDRVEPDPANPGQGPMALIGEILPLLVATSHTMLRQQAKGLFYSEPSSTALERRLTTLLKENHRLVV